MIYLRVLISSVEQAYQLLYIYICPFAPLTAEEIVEIKVSEDPIRTVAMT